MAGTCCSDSEGVSNGSDLKTGSTNQGGRTSSGDGRRQANVRTLEPTLGGELGCSTESSLNRTGSLERRGGEGKKERKREEGDVR